MVGRLWPTGSGLFASVVTAVGIHATTFTSAIMTASVGACVSGFGFYLQWKWKKGDHFKDDIIRSKDAQIDQQQRVIEDMHQWMGGIPMNTKNTDHNARPVDPAGDWTPPADHNQVQ